MLAPNTRAEFVLHYLMMAGMHQRGGAHWHHYIGCAWFYIGFGAHDD